MNDIMTNIESRTSAPTSSLITEINCPFCHSHKFTSFTGTMPDYESQFEDNNPLQDLKFQMVRCEDCQTVYLRRQPTREELWRFYSSEYHCYESYEDRGLIMNTLANLVLQQKIRQFRSYFPEDHKVLLDYGCGSGTWLKKLRDNGCDWRLIGTDIIPEQIKHVQSLDIEGHVCDEHDIDQVINKSSVGIIHLFHVIEHVTNPLYLLEKLYTLLAPGGVIIGQTPNLDCSEQRIFGDYWGQWHFPRHLVVFDHDTLKMHAEKAGFEVVAIEDSLSAATQWSASFLKKRAITKGKPYKSTHEPLYPFLILAALPITIMQKLTGAKTSHMDFILRKPQNT